LGTPFGDSVAADGFNAGALIYRRESDIPYPPDPFGDETPDQRAERQTRTVVRLKHGFSRFAMAFGGIPAIDPMDVTYERRVTINGVAADVLVLRSGDGYVARLYVDASSHLPVMGSWMAAPIVASSRARRGARGRYGSSRRAVGRLAFVEAFASSPHEDTGVRS